MEDALSRDPVTEFYFVLGQMHALLKGDEVRQHLAVRGVDAEGLVKALRAAVESAYRGVPAEAQPW
jgi:hypothetical protein